MEKKAEQEGGRPNLLRRLGAAVAQPSLGFSWAERWPGVAASDAIMLMTLSALVTNLGSTVRGLWMFALGDFGSGLSVLVNVLVRGLKVPLLVVFVTTIALYVLFKAKRKLGTCFDIASVIIVPFLLVHAVGALLLSFRIVSNALTVHYVFNGVSYTWIAALLILAWFWSEKAGTSTNYRGWKIGQYGACGLVLASLLGLAALNGQAVYKNWESLRPMVAGDVAPEITLPTITADGALGRMVPLSSYRGRVVVLDFWATWCTPCKKSMPAINEVFNELKERDLVVLSVNTEGSSAAARARRMVDKLAPDLELVSDVNGTASRVYRAESIPFLVVVDKTGVVRSSHRGFSTAARMKQDLIKELKPLL